MGRFYRTANATPIDYMYRDNIPLMTKVIGANDQYITQSLNEDAEQRKLGDFQYLPQDEEGATALQNQIQQRADDVSKAIHADPANWRKQQPTLQQLKDDLTSQYSNGEISKYVGNYNQMKSDFANADAQVALYHKSGGTKGVDPLKAQLWKQYSLNNFKGTKNPDGSINTFKSNPLGDNIDLNKTLDDTLSKITKDENTKEFTQMIGKGAYFDDESHSWKGIPQDKILSTAMNRIMGDPTIVGNLQQARQIGYINKDITSPFTTKPNTINPQQQQFLDQEQNRINLLKERDPVKAKEQQAELDSHIKEYKSGNAINWNEDSYLTPFLQSALAKYSGATTSDKNKYRNNSLFNQGQQIAATRSNLYYTQGKEDSRLGTKDAFAEHMAGVNAGYKEDEIRLAASLKANNGKGLKKGVVKSVSEPSVLSNKEATPYAYLANDKDNIVKNLQTSLSTGDKAIEQLHNSIKQYQDQGDTDMAEYEANRMAEVSAQQSTLKDRDAKAKETAMNLALPNKEARDLYNNANEVTKRYNALQHISSMKASTPSFYQQMIDSPEYANREKTIADYNKMQYYQSAVNDEYKNQLIKATKETTNGAPIIETTNEQDDFLRRSMASSPAAFKVVDPQTGAEDLNLSLQNGALDPYSDNLRILGSGPSAGLGAGKNIPIHVQITDKDGKVANRDIVPVGPTADIVREKLVSSWASSKKPDVKTLATTMNSSFYNPVKDAVTEINQSSNLPTGTSAPIYKTVKLGDNQSEIKVTRMADNAGYQVKLKMKDGTWATLPKTDDKLKPIGSTFNSDTDIINQLEQLNKKFTDKK